MPKATRPADVDAALERQMLDVPQQRKGRVASPEISDSSLPVAAAHGSDSASGAPVRPIKFENWLDDAARMAPVLHACAPWLVG
jgi:hypothetical protein